MSLQNLRGPVSHRHCAQRRSETLKVNPYVKTVVNLTTFYLVLLPVPQNACPCAAPLEDAAY